MTVESYEPPRARIERMIARFRQRGVHIDERQLEFIKAVGRGSSGVTYKARYKGELVAVKVFDSKQLRDDFGSCANEMELMTVVRHANIVPVHGVVLRLAPLRAAIVMQLAPHGELGVAIHERRASVAKRRFDIALGIARGLACMHAAHIIHRDVKPANVLLGADYKPLLTDFGLSRYIDRYAMMTGETGSYRYMAPEVIRHGRYTDKADVYSYAVCINELWCGERPFDGRTSIEAARDVITKRHRPRQRRELNARVRKLIARCWDETPARRPGWDEVIEQLELARKEEIATYSDTRLAA